MRRFRLLQLVLALALVAAAPHTLRAQSTASQASLPQHRTRLVPPPIPPSPFPANSAHMRPAVSVEFRPANRMSQADRSLVENSEPSLAQHAANSGFLLSSGNWDFQQVVCPALPGHLFLQYTRNNGVGDVTVFSASIPRGSEGRVRIVPILKRSYSLFSPAPINSLTISAFNHIRAEEPATANSDWLGTGLCYAALAGAHPHVPLPQPEFAVNTRIPAQTARLDVHTGGGEVIHFTDAAALPRPMAWSMTFNAKGKLVKATHSPAEFIDTKADPKASATIKTWSLPQD